ncbi:c-type cytochrome [Pedobacter flavus]|uniref:Cytochrome c n=1 Tax=Pedobacter flavus TaxID=3113906 RepID=A0ABU7H287_9SPHI|nr:cytochrome c [Pedobacter sp. VNH31]MEE1885374.1 cytochrome c [Pedobacter sp. VNH31]
MKIKIAVVVAATVLTNIWGLQEGTPLEKSIKNGKLIYEELCISCHMGNGKGMGSMIPPLAQSDYLKKFPNESIAAVKFGQKGKIVVNGVEYNGMMPNPGLSNEEIADVMNYIQNSWGNVNKKMVTVKMVEGIKKP